METKSLIANRKSHNAIAIAIGIAIGIEVEVEVEIEVVAGAGKSMAATADTSIGCRLAAAKNVSIKLKYNNSCTLESAKECVCV